MARNAEPRASEILDSRGNPTVEVEVVARWVSFLDPSYDKQLRLGTHMPQ